LDLKKSPRRRRTGNPISVFAFFQLKTLFGRVAGGKKLAYHDLISQARLYCWSGYGASTTRERKHTMSTNPPTGKLSTSIISTGAERRKKLCKNLRQERFKMFISKLCLCLCLGKWTQGVGDGLFVIITTM
jgi:hypothetical protein